jgi:endonuclease-3
MDAKAISLWVLNRLRDVYGDVSRRPDPPIGNLVLTILSQNTNDVNRDRAFASLMDRFGSMTAVRDAPTEEVSRAIQIGGLHQQKAERIQRVLKRITEERGELDLGFLGDMPLSEAMAWLLESPGVGNKTAGIVMLFSFGKPYFPVDTHIRRVFTRLGVVRTREDPHRRMNAVLPPDADVMATLHLHAIRLGRELCHPRGPECRSCPLTANCTWYKEHVAT